MNIDGARVVVVVATRRGREDLLLERALPSVFAQRGLRPRAVLVVDDDAAGPSPVAARVEGLARRSGWVGEVAVIANRRTRGFSGTGAWNTGAEESRTRLPCGGWLAFLDDDDAWRDTYLARCVGAASAQRAALVVSGLLRVDARGVERQIAPQGVAAAAFLESNPGVQASNLFVALDLFESVGGFDETLPSTTDRDLMIRLLDRLAEYPRPVAHVAEFLVEHHAHDGPRVTTDRRAKHLGLDRFYARYAARMDAVMLRRSLDRAERLFGYRAP